MRAWSGIAVLLVIQLLLTENVEGAEQQDYQGVFDRSDVFVLVEIHGGLSLGHHLIGLACDGRLRIVGAYSDTTAIRATVPPDTALAYINDLLALDFLGQPEEFRAKCGVARPTEDDRITIGYKEMFDARSTRITLHLGPRTHSVLLRYPAYGAPPALLDWDRRLRALVKEHVSWVQF